MADGNKNAIDRRQKFAPDPPTPELVLLERVRQLEAETRLLRQNMQLTTLHAFDRGPYIDPTQGEVLWDFQWQRGYIFHHNEWRPLAPPTYHIKVFADDRPVLTGDGRFKFAISKDMHGMYLYDAEAYVTTAGACTISLYNNTQARDLLINPLVITSLHDTGTRTIHPVNSEVNWKDQIWINVDAAGGQGLGVILVFNPFID
jgi:hypothetical protein